MSSRDQHGPFSALVPLWLLVVVAVASAVVGVGVGQSGLLDDGEETTAGRARLLDEESYLTRFVSGDGEVTLEFNARGVAWVSDTASSDGLRAEPVGCLRLQRGVPVELTVLEHGDRDVVLDVTCR